MPSAWPRRSSARSPLPEGGTSRFAEISKFGLTMAWREHPFEWIEARRMGVLREFKNGPFKWFVSVVELTPRRGGGTTLAHRIRVEPRGLLGRTAAAVEIGFRARKSLERVYRRIDAAVSGKLGPEAWVDAFAIPRRCAVRGDANSMPWSPSSSSAAWTTTWPTAWANTWRMRRRRKSPAFAPSPWPGGCRCRATPSSTPACTAPAMACSSSCGTSSAPYAGFRRRCSRRCATCVRMADARRAISISISISPTRSRLFSGLIRKCATRSWACSASAARPIRRTWRRRRACGPANASSSTLLSAKARTDCADRSCRTRSISASRRTPWPRRWDLSLSRGATATVPRSLHAGSQLLALTNDYKSEVVVRVERAAPRDDALTAGRAAALALFRELFPAEVLAPGRLISIATVTLLVTELEGVEALYDKVGDARAFGLLHEHLRQVTDAATREGGAVVKAVGNGVVAAFNEPAAAVRAALAVPKEVATGAGDRLRVRAAVHRGSAMAATINEHLDYFGTTVTTALRLPAMVRGGELALSAAVAGDPTVATLLQARGKQPQVLDAGLPGKANEAVQRVTLD